MINVDLVVARYSEDLTWLTNAKDKLQSLKYNVRIFVYNKGQTPPHDHPSEQLENIGRESHTYLYHVNKYYNEYTESCIYVMFVQGHFIDHLKVWYPHYKNETEFICAMVDDAIKCNGASISWAKTHDYVGQNAAHWNFRIAYHNNKILDPLVNKPLGVWFTDNVKEEFPKYGLLNWWIAALFCIRSDIITKSHNIDYYKHLLKELSTIDPEVGHFFERSWVYIFGAHTLLQKTHIHKIRKGVVL